MKNNFWLGKKVLITGHTGFKGAWLSLYLKKLGADICGVSLPPPTTPSLYDITNLKNEVKSVICDIRDIKELKKIFLTIFIFFRLMIVYLDIFFIYYHVKFRRLNDTVINNKAMVNFC
mgnify:CR=1 FL=1